MSALEPPEAMSEQAQHELAGESLIAHIDAIEQGLALRHARVLIARANEAAALTVEIGPDWSHRESRRESRRDESTIDETRAVRGWGD